MVDKLKTKTDKNLSDDRKLVDAFKEMGIDIDIDVSKFSEVKFKDCTMDMYNKNELVSVSLKKNNSSLFVDYKNQHICINFLDNKTIEITSFTDCTKKLRYDSVYKGALIFDLQKLFDGMKSKRVLFKKIKRDLTEVFSGIKIQTGDK